MLCSSYLNMLDLWVKFSPITYIWERSVDGGAWTQIGTTSAKTTTDTVPSSGSIIQYRVKAKDDYDLESAYTTGTSKTINKPPTVPASITYGTPSTGKSLAISCAASTDPDGDAITYIWEYQLGTGAWTAIGSATSATSTTLTVPTSTATITIRVKARDALGNESGYRTGTAKNINQPPTVPGTITYSGPSLGKSITLTTGGSTDPDSDAITYVWEYRIDSGAWVSAGTSTALNISHNVPASGLTYTARVKARDAQGNESDYRTGSTLNINQPPTVPSNITYGTPSVGKSIAISTGGSTDPDNDAITYVWEYQLGTGTWTAIGSTAALSTSFTVPTSTATITFRVKARDAVGNESAYRTGTVKNINQPPTVPSSITFGTPLSGKTLTITTGGSTDPDGDAITYVWERQTAGGAWVQIGTGTTLTVTDTVPTVTVATTYNVRVKARDAQGNESDWRTGTVKNINRPPTTPSSATYGVPSAGKSITLTTGGSTDPDGDTITYVWERQVDTGAWTQVGTATTLTLTDTVPTTGTTVTYRVKARDAAGNESAYFTPASSSTINRPPTTPNGISYDSPSAGNSLTISTNGSTDQDGDNITHIWERRIDSGAFVQIGSGSTLSVTDTVPSSGTTYTVRVKARDVNGNESDYTTGTAKVILYNQQPVITLVTTTLGEQRLSFDVVFKVSDPNTGDSVSVVVKNDGVEFARFDNATQNVNLTAEFDHEHWARAVNGAHKSNCESLNAAMEWNISHHYLGNTIHRR
ncbi:hypothetical protein FACS1894184_17180 [Clostridia bacterium]|nr:hypothetical protein FACS1894184_17180 [Clostridia bacterium]